jgi:integrase
MASISKDPGGQRRILFVAQDGSRKVIRLGKVTQRHAETIKLRIEQLIAARWQNVAIDADFASWLTGIGDDLHQKLSNVGLVEPRKAIMLGGLLDAFLAANPHAKPATLVVWGQVARCLKGHFGEDRQLRTIGRPEAEGFRQWLVDEKLAATTVGKRLQFARQFFTYAVRRGWIERNPFEGISHKGGDPRKRQRYITVEETEKLINAAPDWIWRTIIALARFGGLRTPSETLSLRFADLDWERGAMTIKSPKTEGHGQGQRIIPMFARLRPCLEEAWDNAREGQVNVIPEDKYLPAAHGPRGWVNCNLRTTFEKIVKRAGLDPWPRLFHALRASCESDLAREYPITTVCRWIGNTVSIAARHYVQVTDADFQRASGAAQNPAQQVHGMGSKMSQQKNKTPAIAENCEGVRHYTGVQMEAAGIEPASRDISMQASTCIVG